MIQRIRIFDNLRKSQGCLRNFVRRIYDDFLENISSKAFVGISLSGRDYLSSGKLISGVIDKNFGEYNLFSILCSLFVIMGNAFVTGSTMLIGYFLFTHLDYFSKNMSSLWAPLLVKIYWNLNKKIFNDFIIILGILNSTIFLFNIIF